MSSPDTLEILLNAADGYQRFSRLGIDAREPYGVTVSDIEKILASEAGRFFRLAGWYAAADTLEVNISLRINAVVDSAVNVTNGMSPNFTDDYRVVESDCAPKILIAHGDYRFSLARVIQPVMTTTFE